MQGSFVRKRGGTWTAYYYVAGADLKRQQRSKGGFKTKDEAQQYLSSVLHTVNIGEYTEPNKMTVREYLEGRWLPIIESTIRPTTFNSYRAQLRLHVIPRIGSIPLQRLRADHLDNLYVDLLKSGRRDGKEGGLSPKTVRYLHTTIHKALKDAERKQLVTRNVAAAADPPKLRQAGSQEMKTWDVEEVRIFLREIAQHRIGTAYMLAVTTGMRRGEILGLRWSDIDFAAGRVSIRQTVILVAYDVTIGTPKTSRGRRSVALDQATVSALLGHRERQATEKESLGGGYIDQGLVFAKPDGSPLNPDYFSQVFDRTVAKLPVTRIRLHDLRHTHATLGLAAGVPAKVMSDRLGHATVAFTQDVYMHAIPQLESDAAKLMANLIFEDGHCTEDLLSSRPFGLMTTADTDHCPARRLHDPTDDKLMTNRRTRMERGPSSSDEKGL